MYSGYYDKEKWGIKKRGGIKGRGTNKLLFLMKNVKYLSYKFGVKWKNLTS
jgi:hypothetical protein